MGTVDTAGKNLSASALATAGTHYSALYNSTELTASGYARQGVPWGAASGSAVTTSGTAAFSFTGSATLNQIGVHSAVSGGTRYSIDDVAEWSCGAAGGVYTIDVGTLTFSNP